MNIKDDLLKLKYDGIIHTDEYIYLLDMSEKFNKEIRIDYFTQLSEKFQFDNLINYLNNDINNYKTLNIFIGCLEDTNIELFKKLAELFNEKFETNILNELIIYITSLKNENYNNMLKIIKE